jgi:hypothetical protein
MKYPSYVIKEIVHAVEGNVENFDPEKSIVNRGVSDGFSRGENFQ